MYQAIGLLDQRQDQVLAANGLMAMGHRLLLGGDPACAEGVNRYYLATGMNVEGEGPYGLRSDGELRDPSTQPCP